MEVMYLTSLSAVLPRSHDDLHGNRAPAPNHDHSNHNHNDNDKSNDCERECVHKPGNQDKSARVNKLTPLSVRTQLMVTSSDIFVVSGSATDLKDGVTLQFPKNDPPYGKRRRKRGVPYTPGEFPSAIQGCGPGKRYGKHTYINSYICL